MTRKLMLIDQKPLQEIDSQLSSFNRSPQVDRVRFGKPDLQRIQLIKTNPNSWYNFLPKLEIEGATIMTKWKYSEFLLSLF